MSPGHHRIDLFRRLFLKRAHHANSVMQVTVVIVVFHSTIYAPQHLAQNRMKTRKLCLMIEVAAKSILWDATHEYPPKEQAKSTTLQADLHAHPFTQDRVYLLAGLPVRIDVLQPT